MILRELDVSLGDALRLGRFACSAGASCEDDVRQAQRLRYQVFATELGARLTPLAGTMPGLDSDRFDAFCDHLLVRAVNQESDAPGMLVGTYRVLPADAARRAGGLYIDTEFDLAPLQDLRATSVERGGI